MSDIEIKHLDKRTQARYLARGILPEKEFEKHLKSLPDLADQVLDLDVEQPKSDRTPAR
jgi:hypothetical protein